MANVSEPSICQEGGSGVIMPGSYEADWPRGLRGAIYLIFLFWCFMGVAVVSDVFMSAIECITSKRTRKLDKATGRKITVNVWNPTIANLSLMALGSSAPEILLSVIELIGNEFYSGDLGPSTIVGSAAFNLFVIIAICVEAIPEGEVRRIKEFTVYAVTAFSSIFAYLWLLVILLAFTPNVIDLWEGIITFMFFWVLLIAAYAADRGMFPGTKQSETGSQQVIAMSMEDLAVRRAELQKKHGGSLTDEQVTKLLMVESQQHSYASYRAAGRKSHASRPANKQDKLSFKQVVPMGEEEIVIDATSPIIEFKTIKLAVMENAGHVDIWVTRDGALNQTVTVDYETNDGTAKKDIDYAYAKGTLTFQPNVAEQKITVKIIDDAAYEDDEEFFIELSNPKLVSDAEPCAAEAKLGRTTQMTVVIIDDDLPGIFAFPEDTIAVKEHTKDYKAIFTVLRKNGGTGKSSCKYNTENGTAIAGINYEEAEGVLEFESGETQKEIEVEVKARGRYDNSEMFRIILTDAKGGAKMDPDTDGGEDSCILTVMIESDQEAKHQIDRIMSSFQSKWEKSQVGNANWAGQFKNAFLVLGGEEPEEDEDGNVQSPGVMDYVLHVFNCPWKVFFAIIPPTDYCGGWPCFFSALCMIGLVTALVGDIAALFGCICGLPDEITAITIVALGTSLPDAFASKAAAENDPYADASVGNVTGSNSVNVFLGLGLPWTIGAIYWSPGPNDAWRLKYNLDLDIAAELRESGCFVVKAGNLAFSVLVFSVCAATCVAILYMRRTMFDGELGGPNIPKHATAAALVCLWLIYIGLSSWYTLANS